MGKETNSSWENSRSRSSQVIQHPRCITVARPSVHRIAEEASFLIVFFDENFYVLLQELGLEHVRAQRCDGT